MEFGRWMTAGDGATEDCPRFETEAGQTGSCRDGDIPIPRHCSQTFWTFVTIRSSPETTFDITKKPILRFLGLAVIMLLISKMMIKATCDRLSFFFSKFPIF